MPLVLRKISKSRWYIDKPWLQLHDLKADATKDLAATDGKLSIYLVEETNSSTLDRVIAALGANVDRPDKFDFALIDLQLLMELGFETKDTPGVTPDNEVNSWHREMVNLSITKIMRLAFLIRDQAKRDRISQPEVVELVKNGIAAGHLDRNRMKENFLQKIGIEPVDDVPT